MTKLGHDVRIIAPRFVAPYRKSSKNDDNDAEAIARHDEQAKRLMAISDWLASAPLNIRLHPSKYTDAIIHPRDEILFDLWIVTTEKTTPLALLI